MKISRKQRNDFFTACQLSGLDGNQSFSSPSDGMEVAGLALKSMGLEMIDIISDTLDRDGSKWSLGFSVDENLPEDVPLGVCDNIIVFTFYERCENRWEVIAYLT